MFREKSFMSVRMRSWRMHIPPCRPKKLLLHKQEIRKLDGLVARQGYTLVPLEVYLKDGRMKLQLGLCNGKAEHDKRDSIAKRDAERDIRRAIRENNK